MGKLIGSKDWSQTAVGDVASWPQSLKTALSVCLGSKFPMFVWWGPELTVFYNDAYAPILGAAKHPHFLGESARDQWAEVWDTLWPLVEQVHAGNATWFEDFRLFPVIRQGFPEETYFTFSYSPIRDESGRVGGVFCACQETTKRVLADRRLRTLRELAQKTALARAAEEAAKLAASVLEANAADVPFIAIYLTEDATRERLVLEATAGGAGRQTAPSQILLGKAGSSLAVQAGRALVHRGPVVVDGPLDGASGSEDPSSPPSARFVLLQIPSSDQSQPPVGLLLFGVNPCLPFDDDYQGYLALIATQLATAVAAARGHEAERNRTEALAALDRAKTTFFANVSHELRTPLTLMLGPIEDGLADVVHPLNGVQRERQELARRNGLRLQRLVNTLLDFARIEAGRAHASFVPTDLAALTVDLASSFRSALAAAGLELVVDCPPLPEAVYVDPTMWEKIVLNLLSNAFKFTLKGRIRVALEWRGDHVELTVEDSGTGIPADELPHIFERFHRVEGARGRSHEGTGIGLALVQELVRLHEGEAVVQSELGKGSRFTVRLKVRPSRATDVQARAPARTSIGNGIGVESFLAEISQWTIEEPGAAQREGAVANSATNSLPGARILVADDNADMRTYLTRLLTARWSVEAVSDGARALEVARAEAPDLILTDVMMPGVDGLALVRALREDERTRTIPVILLSARAGEESTILGLESGADEYLVKPFSANELLARVNAQLKVAALRKEALCLERARAEESRVHAEQARTLLDKAEVASRSRDRALAIVSHDLRSPLNAISTAAELIKLSLGSEKSAATAHKRAELIGRSVERMNRLIGDLLDASSLEAGALSFELELHDAAAVVREIRDALEHQAHEKGVVLEIEVLEDLPLVWFDRARILQTLENLVQNAVKFTPSGGTVRVRLLQDDEWVRFAVQDDGPGIAPEALPHIVEPYWHSAVGNRQGHGLGLAIAKGIVDAHGGQLAVESTLGAGSVFSVALPLNPSAPLRLAAPRAVAHDAVNPSPAGVSLPAPRQFAERGGEMGELTRAFDWSKTSLGAMSTWPQSLRTSVSTMLRSPYPITLFWGRDQVMLYNDAFRPIHGDKHPGTLGAAAPQALAEAWDVLGPLVRKTLESGEPLFVENGLVVFARRPGGLKEESYFTWSYNPTIGEDGEIAGLFAIASETTRQVVGDRRLSVLRELSIRTAFDRKATGLYRSLEEVLATAGADVPFSLLYIVEGQRARLASCSGVQRGSAAAPEAFELDDRDSWQLAGVVRSGQELLLENLDAKLGALPGGPWQEPATRALALPVPTGADSQSSGVLICGLSPLLHLDEEYRSFLQLLARQVSAGISSARAYEQETQRAEKLAELDRAKTTFFSNVSHEFRTPLTLILGPIEDALAHPARSLEGRKLELVRRSALRLYKMVNALLDFSKVEVGRAQATFVPTDLAAFTTHLVSQFASAAQSAGLELVLDCAPLPEAIYVDPDMWEKVVFNLLSNAVKYTRQGAIRVTLRWEADAAVATVEDTGVGIPQADLEHVFERFYRVQEANGRSYEGTGIGLALARELVELHGGTISVSSRLGDGSTFTVRLPRGSAHLPAERVARTGSPRTSASGAAPFVEEAIRWSDVAEAPSSPDHAEELTTDMPPELLSSHILLVDDNSDLRSYAAGLLGRTFRNVETATNGQDALERVRANRPDLVISDVMMPIMDGFALVRALRGDERTRSVPIILLSARAGAESAVAGLDSGADDYLVKPFSAIELIARVRSQLEMTRVRAEAYRERGISEELRRSVAARDDFISISSHELRTPLTALSLQLESLLRLASKGIAEPVEKQLLTKLAAALRQTDRLTQLVETLLDVSQLSRGALELEPQRVDLAELVTAAVARFEDDARAAGGQFRVNAPSVVGLWDKARLDQLLGSLLSNAVKYAPGTIVDVAVERSPGDDTAKLIVRDSGPGISEEARDRLFQRFERAVPADNYGGFGLGLYLSRRIVEAHGGTIAALSTEGQGTTISVELPVNGLN